MLLFSRGVRGFADGLVSVVLPLYLVARGYSPVRIGALVTATLVGSAAITLLVGMRAHRYDRLRLLRLATVLMIATGVGFYAATSYWLLVAVAVAGTLNPSSGDVSVFLPTEQALLPATVAASQRTTLFARYAFIGAACAAVGALAAGLPEQLRRRTGLDASEASALRSAFLVYAACGVVVWFAYRRLRATRCRRGPRRPRRWARSRGTVYRLSALFSLDSFGGGFVVQSILVLWLSERHQLSTSTTGLIFFWSGLASGVSTLAAPWLARRIGLIRTMAFTHLPANVFLLLAAFAPSPTAAVALLLARAALSQMDVPARTSYVMAVVEPAERPAAASITNVPRSLAAALPPFAAGWLLEHSSFGWPLVLGGGLKAVYDVLLLLAFAELRPPEER
ncbi:MAG: MFS transporter [Acidimicrobiales bacterium]